MKKKILPMMFFLALGVFLSSNLMAQTQFYDLYVTGEQVTSDNAGDLSVLAGVDGEVTYDPATNILTLNNATINTGAAIENFMPNLKVILTGVNTIEASVFCLKNHASTQIEGSGSLIANSSNTVGVFMLAPLTIKDCTIEAEATKWGIAGNDGASGEDLIIENATVKATGAAVASIADIQSLTLNACAITAPEGAAFDEGMHAVALNGSVVKEQIVIEPFNGIKDNMEMANISAYPNPVNEILYLEIEASNFNAEFYNAQGQLVLQEQNNKSISVANLPSGVYMLKLVTEKGTYSRRIMKN